jgi:predicted DNA-binding ribbon-helix-helix protein
MERTTLMLTADVRAKLRQIAAQRDVSMATIIREAIDDKLASERPLPSSLGIGASGVTDTARRTGQERPEPRSWR